MYAKVTSVRFKLETQKEATHIYRDIMLPMASAQKGFKGALMLKNEKDSEQHFFVSMWETEADMNAEPPEALLPYLEPLEDMITEVQQDIYQVLLQLLQSSNIDQSIEKI